MTRRGWVCVMLFCVLACARVAWADAPATGAKAAVLIDFESGRVLYEKRADERLPIASVTKIMTCLLALENCALDDVAIASKRASGVPGTSIYLGEGESLTIEHLLYGLMLRSGNDAAVCLSEHIAGSVSAFSEMMNERAYALGADAFFTTPNGLDEGGNGASARGVALIAREAMRNADFARIVSTKRITIPWAMHDYARVLTNKNKLLTEYEGALGIKTGFTSKAGRCLAFAAEREGLTLIGVVLNCPAWFDDAKALMDWGFEEYTREVALPGGEAVASAPVMGGSAAFVELFAREPLAFALGAGEKYSIEYEIYPASAPVRAGDRLGRAVLRVEGEILCERELYALNDVGALNYARTLKRVWSAWPLIACQN